MVEGKGGGEDELGSVERRMRLRQVVQRVGKGCCCCYVVVIAKVSGSEVPSATNVIAVIGSGTPRVHPNKVAYSPTTKVTTPIRARATKKQA